MASRKSKKPRPEVDREERTKDGKFKNFAGPGNVHLQQMRMYREAISAAVPPDTCAKIIQKFAILAVRDGDVAAGKVVLERMLGKPREMPIGASYPLKPPESVEEAQLLLRKVTKAYAAGDMDEQQVSTHIALIRAFVDTLDSRKVKEELEALRGDVARMKASS